MSSFFRNFFSLEHYGRRLLILLAPLGVVFCYLAFGPVKRETRNPLYNGIWDSENQNVINNERAKQISGYVEPQFLRIPLFLKEGVEVKALLELEAETRRYKNLGWKAISVSSYWKRGKNGEPDSYWIPPDFVDMSTEESLRLVESLKDEIVKDEAIAGPGKLVVVENGEISELAIQIRIPADQNEIAVVKDFYRDFEGVAFSDDWRGMFTRSQWEMSWGTTRWDAPNKETEAGGWTIQGWPSFRGGITFGFFVNSTTLQTIGYLPLFFFLLVYFRWQWRYCTTVLLSMVLTQIFTLGSIWFLHWFGMYQTAYSLPPQTTNGIVTVSFCVQLLEMSIFLRQAEQDPVARWRIALSEMRKPIDRITGANLFGFLVFGLWFSNLARVVEMDALYIIGATIWARVFALFFSPAIYLFMVRKGEKEKELWRWQEAASECVVAAVACIGRFFMRACLRVASSRGLYALVSMLPSILLAVFYLAYKEGLFDTATRPMEYLPQYSEHVRALKRANKSGGSDGIKFIFGDPRISDCLKDERCFWNTVSFMEQLKKLPGVNGISAPIIQETLYQIQERQSGGSFADIASDVLFAESDMDPTNRSALNPAGSGVMLIIALHKLDNSEEIRATLDPALELCKMWEEKNDGYVCFSHGEVLLYVDMAELFPEQLPQFVFLSVGSFLVYVVVFMRKDCRGRRCQVSPVRVGWAVAQPLMFGTGFVAIWMLLFHIPWDMATGAILPTALACSSDSVFWLTLLFLELLQEGAHPLVAMRDTMAHKGEAIVLDGVTNTLGLVPLMISFFGPVRYLGGLSGLALCACLGWSLIATLPIIGAGVKRKEGTYEPQSVVDGDPRGRYVVHN